MMSSNEIAGTWLYIIRSKVKDLFEENFTEEKLLRLLSEDPLYEGVLKNYLFGEAGLSIQKFLSRALKDPLLLLKK